MCCMHCRYSVVAVPAVLSFRWHSLWLPRRLDPAAPETHPLTVPEARAVSRGAGLCRYELLSGQQKRGAYGVTQFAVLSGQPSAGAGGASDVGIKFFSDEGAFERVALLYAHPTVASCMHVVREIVAAPDAAGAAASLATGVPPMPSAVVTWRLETLEEWAARVRPGPLEVVAAVAGIADALADLHEAGYVYYNMKPSDVGWLPAENMWMLLDFGRCVRAGMPCPRHFRPPPACARPWMVFGSVHHPHALLLLSTSVAVCVPTPGAATATCFRIRAAPQGKVIGMLCGAPSRPFPRNPISPIASSASAPAPRGPFFSTLC